MNALSKLINVSSDSICKTHDLSKFLNQGSIYEELKNLLHNKNGFYAFESALLVRPWSENITIPLNLEKWNDINTWLETYDMKLPQLFFFAEDIFGGQFAILKNEIVSFDPETGEIKIISNSLEDWASQILDDYDYFTGYTLAKKWQRKNKILKFGERLIPKKLFVLGGEFEISNLIVKDEVYGMRIRGGYASKLCSLPDGTEITFDFTD